MNKYRLNQILTVLLFPVTDPEQGRKDILLECCDAYHAFMQECEKITSSRSARQRKNEEYRKAQKKLREYLTDRNRWRIKSEDDVQLLCEMYYPMSKMEREMEWLEKRYCQKDNAGSKREIISLFYMRNLQKIAVSLITHRDGVAVIRQGAYEEQNSDSTDIFGSSSVFNKIEIWNLLCRFTVPDIYIAIAAVESGQGIEALFEQKPQIMLADRFLKECLKKGIAENHMHFNVGYDYENYWLIYTNLEFVEKTEKWDKESYTRLEVSLFRYLASDYLKNPCGESGFKNYLDQAKNRQIRKIIVDLYHGYYGEANSGKNEKPVGEKECRSIYKLYQGTRLPQSIYEYDYLLDIVYSEYVEYKTSSEFIFLYKSYQYIKENDKDIFFSHLFLQYIRLKNAHFYEMNERNVISGLKFFQRSYAVARSEMGKLSLPTESRLLEIFRSQSKISHLKKLEVRVAPIIKEQDLGQMDYCKMRKRLLPSLRRQLTKILNAYKRYILESAVGVRNAYRMLELQKEKPECANAIFQQSLSEIRKQQPGIPTLGIVFHFLKHEELEYEAGSYCWRSMLDSSDRDFASRMYRRLFFMNVAIAIQELRVSIPKLSEYLVGIDAASDECAMEPWMFAAAYKAIRSCEYAKPVAKRHDQKIKLERIQDVGFTYHVGEDVRHLVSGFRHIDEVLEHFGYTEGDRLGHALSLGADVEQWIMDNEAVPMPLLEHMENLLWIWGIAVHEGLNLELELEILEDKILDIAQKIYPYAETITVRMLYKAYRKKFDTNHKEIFQKLICEEKEMEPEHTFCKHAENDQTCRMMWSEERESSIRYCPVLREMREQGAAFPLKGVSGYYNRWSEDKLLSTNYCPVFEERANRKELIPVRRKDVELYRRLQEYLVQKVEQRGIYVEENPTSNEIIGEIANMQAHPLFYLNQKIQEGKHRILVTINSDNPAVFNTNVENELAYVYYAAETKGYPRSELMEWIDHLRQYGMDASFIQKVKSAETLFIEVEEILRALKNLDI